MNFLKYFGLLFMPLISFLLNLIPFPVIIKFIFSILIFYVYFGYEFYQILLIKLIRKNNPDIASDIISTFLFSITCGICLNCCFGFSILINQYYSLNILLFYQLLAFIFLLFKKKPTNKPFSEPIKSHKQFLILFVLLVPQLIYILIQYNLTPFPYQNAWDLLYYQGMALHNLYFPSASLFNLGNFPFFSIMLSNILLLSNVNPIFLMEFSKMGTIFTSGLQLIMDFSHNSSLNKIRKNCVLY